MSDFKESMSERSIRSNNFLYTKPILSLNELNAKKLNFSHCNNISFGNNTDFIKKRSFDNNNNKNISTNKKSNKEIKRLFTFMDSENTNKNSAVDNTPLLQGSKNSLNLSKSRNSLIILENNNSNSNFECQRKAFSISGNNTKRNNTSTLNDDSINYNNTNLWKFKTIEDDNIFHNKKTSGNTTVTTYSYNIDITNQNALYPIYEWLKEINLVCYYNLFIDKNNLIKLKYE